MMIAKPHNSLNPVEVEKYKNNIVSVTEELVYNPEIGTGAGGRGDLTIFVNGLPLIWIELKSNSAGQDINNAINFITKNSGNYAGIVFEKQTGDSVVSGDKICTIYANTPSELSYVSKMVEKAIKLGKRKINIQSQRFYIY